MECHSAKQKDQCHIRDEEQYICPLCDEQCKSADQLNRHGIECHSIKRKKHCFEGKEQFKTTKKWDTNFQMDSQQGDSETERSAPYLCVQYNAVLCMLNVYSRLCSLIQSGKEDHGQINEQRFECIHCQSSLSTVGNLKRHVRRVHEKGMHEKERNYDCNICSKSFFHKDIWKAHLKTHSDDRPFGCHICSKRYKLKGHLKQHVEGVHSNNRPYRCECGRNYKRKSELTRHQLTHLETKPFPCTQCDKLFTRRHLLKLHIDKSHLQESKRHPVQQQNSESERQQQYRCAQCNAVYEVKWKLKVHTRLCSLIQSRKW